MKYKWTIEIEIDEKWVEDGFDLSDSMQQEALLDGILPFAYSSEKSLKIIKKPTVAEIKEAQGY